jgi:hypothetical protein
VSQGTTRATILSSEVSYADSMSLDAFSRLRVTQPQSAFDAQFTYDLQPLVFEALTSGSGATIAHDTTNRCALHTFSSTPTGGISVMQSYEHMRYQPGKSLAVFTTFNFIEATANVVKFAGYSDGSNGIEFQLSGSTKQFVIYSDTGNGDQTVAQSSWNLDKLDGTGASGLTLDVTKVQILVLDLQALYTGRVRIGFDIGGRIIYAHEFNHANAVATPYIQTANLPIRAGMTCTGTVSTTMLFICSSVVSEGGHDTTVAYNHSVEGAVTASGGARTHALSIRPRTTFNSIVNRAKVILIEIEVLAGLNPVLWEIVVGQAITGASWSNVNTSLSTVESSGGTISGSPAVVMHAGYVGAGAAARETTSNSVSTRYPITLDAAGVVRANGTVSVLLTGIGGTSASRVTLNWMEVR